MAWLVSMKWQVYFWKGPGHVTHVGPNEGLVLLQEHPAKYAADCKTAFSQLVNSTAKPSSGQDRADDILAIYSAIEVPDGLLTEDEADRLS